MGQNAPTSPGPAAVPAKPRVVETIERYLARLASVEPAPGGGSAATVVASTGAALVAMVARICAGNPKYAVHLEACNRIAGSAERIVKELAAARERDEQAFGHVVEAQALPRETEAQKASRAGAIERALAHAAEEPLKTAALTLDVLHLAKQLLAVPNKNLASDVGCAAEFAWSALVACVFNVRINHKYMRDDATVARQLKVLERYEREGGEVHAAVRHAVAEGLRR